MMSIFTKIIGINLLFLFVFNLALSDEIIYPKKKPILSKEIIEKKISKNLLIPLKKPKKIPLEKPKKIKDEIKEKKVSTLKGVIIPKSKPLIVKKGASKIAKKSKFFNKRDFAYAKQAIQLMEKRKWKSAEKVAKKARNKSIYNFIQWKHLLTTGNTASFFEYKQFIERNNNYPRLGRIKYLSEHKLSTKVISPKKIIQMFENQEPLSGYGKIILGESLIATGDKTKGTKLIKEGWITADLTRSDLKIFKKKFKKYLNTTDYINRADHLAWENKYWDLKRMLRYLPNEYQLLYTARQLLMSKSYGVDNAINKVPKKFINDSGLNYDRLKWRRKRGRLEPSLEILFKLPNDPKKLVRPDIWWKERAILARSLIYKKKYAKAYKVSSNHSLVDGPEYAEAEWLSGWIALTFLDDPDMALRHFKNFYNNVGYPISLSRGAYWIGKVYKIKGNKQKKEEWFKNASQYLNTYYGQLAYLELNHGKSFKLDDQPKVNEKYKKEFNKNSLIKIIKLLKELDQTEYSKDFIKHLALLNVDQGSEILAGNLAIEVERYDYAIQIAKTASYEKRFYNKLNYPIISTPAVVNKKRMPNPELVLAVIRQESEFDLKATSSAGARGMMQLMTYTAKLVAKQANLSYSKSKLRTDPTYNIKLGSYYLAGLLEEYEGSFPFALAAYNAGPKRVKYWNKINGNPQKGKIDYVNWIELIKFKETRNYVQRVLENVNVYKYILTGKPVDIYNFFEDKPHY